MERLCIKGIKLWCNNSENGQRTTNTKNTKTQQKQYSATYQKNIEGVENKLGIKKGKEMSFLEADELRGNPNFSKGGGFRVDCQSCVVANEQRRRGFDVHARNTDKTLTVYRLDFFGKNKNLGRTKTRHY